MLGCSTVPPRIGQGLHVPACEVQTEFDRRVRAQFPIGPDEAALHSELVGEKFRITRDKDSPFSFSAKYISNALA
jgi:hypothetical protein